jgi:hypothetical protein
MAELIRNLKDSGRICCTMKEVIIQGTTSPTTCLHFLNDIGYILFNSISGIICVNIPIFAKAMAYIIEPEEHLERMFGNLSFYDHESSGIFPLSEVKKRCTLMLEKNKLPVQENNSAHTNDEIITQLILCFKEFDFCFEMNPIEKDLYKVSHIQVSR